MVSVILCTYNRAHTLKATIDSILKQTYTAFELIIVDDGSTDDTQKLIEHYKDARIRSFVLAENSYYCAAANFGIEKAQGEYIAFATSDDIWSPYKLEKQMDYLEKCRECGTCFTFAGIIDEDGKAADERYAGLASVLQKNYYTRRDWIQRLIFEGNCICHPSAVVRREVLDKVGGYHLYYGHLADMDLWLRILRYYSIHMIEEPLVSYRYFENAKDQISGVSEEQVTRSLNEHMIIRRNFINDLTDKEMLEFFDNKFRYKEAYSHLELEIEKAFLLMHCIQDLPNLWVLGMEKFEELLRDSEAVKVLKEIYQIRPQDIYKWNFQHFYMDYGIHNRFAEKDKELQRLQDEFYKLNKNLLAITEDRKALSELLAVQREQSRDLEEELSKMRSELEENREKLLMMKRTLDIKEKVLEEIKIENEEKTAILNEALLKKLKIEEKWKRR